MMSNSPLNHLKGTWWNSEIKQKAQTGRETKLQTTEIRLKSAESWTQRLLKTSFCLVCSTDMSLANAIQACLKERRGRWDVTTARLEHGAGRHLASLWKGSMWDVVGSTLHVNAVGPWKKPSQVLRRVKESLWSCLHIKAGLNMSLQSPKCICTSKCPIPDHQQKAILPTTLQGDIHT